MTQNQAPFVQFKAMQRETWAELAVDEAFTTPPAADLVAFANVVRARLGGSVGDLRFERGVAVAPALSPLHTLAFLESTFGPLETVLAATQSQPERAAIVRAEVLDLVTQAFIGDAMRQQFLMTRAVKKGSEASR